VRTGGARVCGAFTVVELMVVIAVIALVLAIGVPAFNSMTAQQRLSKTRQLLNGTLTRTHVISLSDRNLTAVRIFPADWDLGDDNPSRTTAGRQMIATYSYRATSAANPNAPSTVSFDERFERIEGGPTHLLPPDTWVAPSEALLDRDYDDQVIDGDRVLQGEIGRFAFDPNDTTELLSADDFLIVFDPETGVVRQNNNWPWRAWRLLAFDPRPRPGEPGGVDTGQLETDGQRRNTGVLIEPYQRFNFTGVVVYPREPFAALDQTDMDGDDLITGRRSVLQRLGQTYYVSRTGGSLMGGGQETVTKE
jgi:type II secretory pathway pseudopilin PulG